MLFPSLSVYTGIKFPLYKIELTNKGKYAIVLLKIQKAGRELGRYI